METPKQRNGFLAFEGLHHESFMLRRLFPAEQSLALLTRWFAVQLIILDVHTTSKEFTTRGITRPHERYSTS